MSLQRKMMAEDVLAEVRLLCRPKDDWFCVMVIESDWDDAPGRIYKIETSSYRVEGTSFLDCFKKLKKCKRGDNGQA